MQGTATVSILDLIENKPKLMSIKLADYDEGGNDKVPSNILFISRSVVLFSFLIPFPPSYFLFRFLMSSVLLPLLFATHIP